MAAKNRRQRKQAPAASPVVRYTVIGLGVVALLLGLATTREANAHHPDPRENITAAEVQASSRYIDYPQVAAVYDMAAAIPEVLDGLYCYCDCDKHSGHRSLLTCFRDDHGAACDICLDEAKLAYEMTNEGRSLKEIRKAVDDIYRR
jgi:hypothetical protein